MKAPRRLAAAVTVVAIGVACRGSRNAPRLTECRAATQGFVKASFHGDSRESRTTAHLGWSDRETVLTPDRVGRGMHSLWTSPPFATTRTGGTTYPGRTYASPLYADGVRIASGAASGASLSVVFVATSNGDVYALAANDATCSDGAVEAGTVLWRTRIVEPGVPPKLDGRDATQARPGEGQFAGIAVGTLSTPALDLPTSTLFVTAMDATGPAGNPTWKAFAIDITTGDVKPGWPVVLERGVIEAATKNGPAYFDEDARFVSQRSALALSPDGARLYIGFGGYWDEAVGWLVAVDTQAARVSASFAAAADTLLDGGQRKRHANGGIWAAGGPAIDERGRVYVTTGNSPEGDAQKAQTWGSSMLRFGRDLDLEAAYTPWDYCDLDARDIDISGSSPLLLPTLDGTTTPTLLAFGGKAGVVYLLDRDALPAARGAAARPACASGWQDAAKDRSLLPPDPAEPYCDGFGPDHCAEPGPSTRCSRGPLQVFGPAGDDASVDRAKMRTTPAFFRSDDGAFLYVSGSTKAKRCTPQGKPPSLVRLRVAVQAGAQAWLSRDAADEELRFVNPGSPVVTSNGSSAPIVWVVDENATRSQPLLDPAMPAPVLYAIDGRTMKRLWNTSPSDLEPGGKYVTPVIAHGVVYVATDRLHAFGANP